MIRSYVLVVTATLILDISHAIAQTEDYSAFRCVFNAAFNTLDGDIPTRSKGLESMYVGHQIDFAFSRLPTATVTTDINSATMKPMEFVVQQRGSKSNGWVLYRVGIDSNPMYSVFIRSYAEPIRFSWSYVSDPALGTCTRVH